MKSYRVKWEIDIDAETPREAAEKARELQLNPDAQVGAFVVKDKKGGAVFIDLTPETPLSTSTDVDPA